MIGRLFAGTFVASVPLLAQTMVMAAGTPCANLAALTIPDVTINSVDNRGTPVPRGANWRKVVSGTAGDLSSKDQAAARALLPAELAGRAEEGR